VRSALICSAWWNCYYNVKHFLLFGEEGCKNEIDHQMWMRTKIFYLPKSFWVKKAYPFPVSELEKLLQIPRSTWAYNFAYWNWWKSYSCHICLTFQIFFHMCYFCSTFFKTFCESTHAEALWSSISYSWEWSVNLCGWGVKLITHLQLVPTLRMQHCLPPFL
jgi:hypothetical protein